MKAPRFRWLLAISAGLTVADQLTKWIVAAQLEVGTRIAILPFFDLVRWHNTGAAFGIFSDGSGWQNGLFLVLGLVLVLFLGSMMRNAAGRGDGWWALGLSLMIGGAMGNLVDRVVRGHVLDFVSLHYGGWYFPAFNLADSGITVGVVLVLLQILRQGRAR